MTKTGKKTNFGENKDLKIYSVKIYSSADVDFINITCHSFAFLLDEYFFRKFILLVSVIIS